MEDRIEGEVADVVLPCRAATSARRLLYLGSGWAGRSRWLVKNVGKLVFPADCVEVNPDFRETPEQLMEKHQSLHG